MSVQRRYWDSTAFIAFFADEKGRVDLCQGVLDAAEQDEVQIVTSALTLSEVVHIRGRERLTPELEQTLVAFFEQPYIIVVDLIRDISENARELLWRYQHLRPKDANHLATAIYANVAIIDAFDEDFLRLDGQLQTLDGTPIRIGYPDLPYQTRLDL